WSGRGSRGRLANTPAQFGCSAHARATVATSSAYWRCILTWRTSTSPCSKSTRCSRREPGSTPQACTRASGSTYGSPTPEIPLPTLAPCRPTSSCWLGSSAISVMPTSLALSRRLRPCVAPALPCSGRGAGRAAIEPMRFGAALSRRASPGSASTPWIATVSRRSGQCGSSMRPSRCQLIGCSRFSASRETPPGSSQHLFDFAMRRSPRCRLASDQHDGHCCETQPHLLGPGRSLVQEDDRQRHGRRGVEGGDHGRERQQTLPGCEQKEQVRGRVQCARNEAQGEEPTT